MEGTWKLISSEGKNLPQDVKVEIKNGRISYKYGNSYDGCINVNGDQVNIHVAGTEMGCNLDPDDCDVSCAISSSKKFRI